MGVGYPLSLRIKKLHTQCILRQVSPEKLVIVIKARQYVRIKDIDNISNIFEAQHLVLEAAWGRRE